MEFWTNFFKNNGLLAEAKCNGLLSGLKKLDEKIAQKADMERRR